MIDIQQRCLCAFQQNGTAARSRHVEKVRCVADERRQTLNDRGSLFDDRFRIEWLAAIRYDNSISVFQIPCNSRPKDVRHQCIGNSKSAPSGFIFVSWSNAAQGRAQLPLPSALLLELVLDLVVGEDDVGAVGDVQVGDRDAL